MATRWLSVLLSSGEIIADLASVGLPQSPLRRTIGQYDTTQISVYLDGAPSNWLRATRPGAAALVCYDDDDPQQLPQWGGFVVTRSRSLKSGKADLSLATYDAYFDRRIVGDRSFTQVGQNAIGQSLVYNYAGSQGRYPGVPFVYQCEDGVGVDGTLRDRNYLDADNATLYNRLRQLSGVIGGLEWTVDLVWDDTNTLILPRFRYGSRIGISPPAGRRPEGVFDDGSITDATYLESYADGDGANVVSAYSSGQSSNAGTGTTPSSGPMLAQSFNLRPAFEYRYQPSTSITDVVLLQSYAAKAVAVLAEGQNSLTLTCALTAQSRYGGLWRLGDDVESILEPSWQFPSGVDVVARAVAYEVDPEHDAISPILATDAIPTGDEEE